jgi:hypothetical protein
MRHKAIVVSLAMVTICAVLGPASAGREDRDRGRDRGYVIPCSLDGVNPVFHPEIFGSPAVARSYGFVRSASGGWQVVRGCRS